MSDSLQKRTNNSIQSGQRNFQFVPNYTYETTSGNNGLDPQRIIALLLRYKWVVLLFLIAGATGAWFYADYVTPVYESRGSLLINSDHSPNDELSQIISKTTGYGTSSTMANELQVLRSRKFSLQIAQKLIGEEPGNISEFPVLWTREEEGNVYRSADDVVASRIRDNIEFRQPEDDKDDVVEVSFKSSSPREAARIVNEAMEIYVENSTRQNRHAAESTATFLANEKEKIKQKLEASERKLQRYMDATGIVQEDEQANGLVTQKMQLDAELQDINLKLATVNESIDKFEQQLNNIKPGLSEQFSKAIGPRIKSAQEELTRFERERSLILAKNPGVLDREPLPPRLQYVNKQIDRLKSQIRDLSSQLFTGDGQFLGMDGENRADMISTIQGKLVDLRLEENQYSTQKEALLNQKKEIDARFNSLPQGMIDLAKLKRDVRINEELYTNVSKQYSDMAVWKQSQFGFGRIIDTGQIPENPVSPNKKILVILGLMLGGLFSAGFIFIREFSDNSVKSVDQLRTMYLPTLTAIPTFAKVSKKHQRSFTVGKGKVPDELVLLNNRSSVTSESIRRLKNEIIYQHGDIPPKTVAVTSPEKGDGKSTIAANLGVAFAEEGYKTLLLDADFRRPKIQKYFGLSNEPGLTDYLDGDLPIQRLIRNSELNMLKIVTAGKEPHRPDLIGSSKAFRQFISKMEELFEVIILDTPPFGVISDASALLKAAEATLVVARYRTTNKGMLQRTIEELGQIQANVTNIVLNDFDHRKETGGYYGSGYYQSLYSNYESYVK